MGWRTLTYLSNYRWYYNKVWPISCTSHELVQCYSLDPSVFVGRQHCRKWTANRSLWPNIKGWIKRRFQGLHLRLDMRLQKVMTCVNIALLLSTYYLRKWRDGQTFSPALIHLFCVCIGGADSDDSADSAFSVTVQVTS